LNAGNTTCAWNILPQNALVRSVCFFYLVAYKLPQCRVRSQSYGTYLRGQLA